MSGTNLSGSEVPHDGWATDWVEIDGRRVSLHAVRNQPEQYVRLLSAARTHKSAVCLCQTPPLRLVTRAGQSGRHHLAVWPEQGPLHDPKCAFHRLDPDLSGQSVYETAAIRNVGDAVAIRFAAPLVSRPGMDRPPPSDQQGGDKISRRSVGLLGVLHYLWDEAKLSASMPGTPNRAWAAVEAAVTEQLAGLTISGQPAGSVLHVVPPYTPDTAGPNLDEFDTFIDSLRSTSKQVRRGFVLGEIKEIRESKFGYRYQLAHQSPARGIYVSERLDALLRRRYRHPFAQAATEVGGRKVALLYIERSRNGFATAVDAAVMLTNRAYIPADSSYEVQMADALIRAGRAFIKPLRYDTHDAVFPDFVLTDTPERTVVEVWGMPGREDYETRKATKQAHYQQRSGMSLIEWTITDPIPDVRRR
ncbi:DUF1173 family protein [Nocardia rhamnosiphila]